MPTRPRPILTAALAALALAVPAAANAAVPAPPKPPVTPPSSLDILIPSYQETTTCVSSPTPGVAYFGALMAQHYNRHDYGTVRSCAGDDSQHYDGRAVDWMLDVNDAADKEIADAVTKWLTAPDSKGNYGANARRFGLMLIIWNGKAWKSYRNPETWVPYTGSVPHTDHIHFSFAWDGACKRTSWWTGKALTSASLANCSGGGGGGTGPLVDEDTEFTKVKSVLLKVGSAGSAVRLAQSNLPGVDVDGEYGPMTASAVRKFQDKWDLDVTGRVNRGVWNQMEKLQYPLIKYRQSVVLRQGMSGQAVKDAQRALRVSQDGEFGPGTQAAVKRVQGKYRLAQTGVIRELTWAALDEELRSRRRMAQLERELPEIDVAAIR